MKVVTICGSLKFQKESMKENMGRKGVRRKWKSIKK